MLGCTGLAIFWGGNEHAEIAVFMREQSLIDYIADTLYWTRIVQHWCSDVRNSYEIAQIASLASYCRYYTT